MYKENYKKTKAEFQTAVSTKIAIADCSLKIGQDAITHFSTQTLVHTVFKKTVINQKIPENLQNVPGSASFPLSVRVHRSSRYL